MKIFRVIRFFFRYYIQWMHSRQYFIFKFVTCRIVPWGDTVSSLQYVNINGALRKHGWIITGLLIWGEGWRLISLCLSKVCLVNQCKEHIESYKWLEETESYSHIHIKQRVSVFLSTGACGHAHMCTNIHDFLHKLWGYDCKFYHFLHSPGMHSNGTALFFVPKTREHNLLSV